MAAQTPRSIHDWLKHVDFGTSADMPAGRVDRWQASLMAIFRYACRACVRLGLSDHAVRLWVLCSELEITTVADLLHDEVDDTLESRLAAVKLQLSFEAQKVFNGDVVDAFPFFDKAVEELLHPPAAAAADARAEPTARYTLPAYINGFFTEDALRDAGFVDFPAARKLLRERILPALERNVYALEPLPLRFSGVFRV